MTFQKIFFLFIFTLSTSAVTLTKFMSSSEKASAYLHVLTANYSKDPPKDDEVIQMVGNAIPTAPLLEPISFASIFGVATNVQFEWNSSGADGYLQAKGEVTRHNTTVRNVNGLEMLKIIERSVDEVDGKIVHTFGIIHKHAALGNVKVTEKSSPCGSLKIFDRNGSPVVVNSLKVGDYAIFRSNLLATALCNLQMHNPEIYDPEEFNVKMAFHPNTEITEEEQLLCTAAAIAFKVAMKQTTKTSAKEDKCLVNFGVFMCLAVFIALLVVIYIVLDRWGCEHKKASG